MRRFVLVSAVSSGLWAGCAAGATARDVPVQGPETTLKLVVSGASAGASRWSHAVDSDHGCSVGSSPFGHSVQGAQTVEVPEGPPTFLVQFTDRQRSFYLRISPYSPARMTVDGLADARAELRLGARVWRLSQNLTPGGSLHVDFDPNGDRGSFQAKGLTPVKGATSATLDIQGEWACGQK